MSTTIRELLAQHDEVVLTPEGLAELAEELAYAVRFVQFAYDHLLDNPAKSGAALAVALDEFADLLGADESRTERDIRRAREANPV